MKHNILYAALNLSVLIMALGVLLFAGAWAEGSLQAALSFSVCFVLICGIRASWRLIQRMETLAAQKKSPVRTPKATAQHTAPNLRVA